MLFQNLHFSIAIAYLKLKKFEGIIALLSLTGIILGVATLVIVTSVMNGFYTELQKQIIGANGHIEIINSGADNRKNNAKILQTVSGFSEIEHFLSTIQKESLISNHVNTLAVMVKGVTLDDLKKQRGFLDKILYGNIDDFEHGIMIGNQIANLLNLSIGDEVKIIVPEFTNTLIGQIPRMKTYKIVSVFSFGMYEYDATTVYIPFESAKKLYKTDFPNFYEIYLKNENNAEVLVKSLKSGLNIPIYSWQEKQISYFNALKTERSVMFIILSLIVIVASFNIISTLVVLVEDKKKSIAILRTIGITEFSIIKIFVICGLIIGIIGTLVGIILGLIFTHYINQIRSLIEELSGQILFEPGVYFFNEIPTIIIFSDIFKIILLSLTSAFIATIIPAIKAAKTPPAEILRYE